MNATTTKPDLNTQPLTEPIAWHLARVRKRLGEPFPIEYPAFGGGVFRFTLEEGGALRVERLANEQT